jgi:hypothetical protein
LEFFAFKLRFQIEYTGEFMATEQEHSLLNDVATAIGSTLGSVAAKVESVTKTAPARSRELKTKVRRAGAAAEREAKSVSRKVKARVKSGAASVRRSVKSTARSARKTFKGARAKAARGTKRTARKVTRRVSAAKRVVKKKARRR